MNRLFKLFLRFFGAFMLFICCLAFILFLQGKFNRHTFSSLIKGTTPDSDKPNSEIKAKPQSSKEKAEDQFGKLFPMPPPFSYDEVASLVKRLQDTQKDYETRMTLLKEKEENLSQVQKDVDERKKEIEKMMHRLEVMMMEFESQKRQWKQEVLILEKDEKKNLKSMTSIYEKMAPDAAAERLNEMEEKVTAKILSLMKPRNAAQIMAALPPGKVKVINNLIRQLVTEKQREENAN